MNILIVPLGKEKKFFKKSLEIVQPSKIIFIESGDEKALLNDIGKIKYDIKKIDLSNIWEHSFEILNEITSENHDEKEKTKFFLDASMCSGVLRSSMITAAFTSGMKVLNRQDDELILLPIYKFTYYRELTDKKKEVLELLFDAENQEMGLELLSEKTHMSLPLISYHINGNQKSEGLKELGLVVSREEKGRSYIHLTAMGRMLLKGHVKHEAEK